MIAMPDLMVTAKCVKCGHVLEVTITPRLTIRKNKTCRHCRHFVMTAIQEAKKYFGVSAA